MRSMGCLASDCCLIVRNKGLEYTVHCWVRLALILLPAPFLESFVPDVFFIAFVVIDVAIQPVLFARGIPRVTRVIAAVGARV